MRALRFLFYSLVMAVTVPPPPLIADFQGSTHLMPYEDAPIHYATAASSGPIPKLQEAINSGKVILNFDPKYGYLLSVLKALNISTTSQTLVFSKSSFQRDLISPSSPRALFFNDDTYIGWIPGAPLLEVSQADPKLGAVFYTLDQQEFQRPKFQRNDQCLECHASSKTMGVPGHVLRSFSTDAEGVVDLSDGIGEVTDATPISERWAGWYVSGANGQQSHRGNLIGKAAFARQIKEPGFNGNKSDLCELVDLRRYPLYTSDIVALMVVEHQTHLHNFIARLNYEAALAQSQYGHFNYLKSKIEALGKAMVLSEQAELTNAISGSSGFTRWFETQEPHDAQKRSLRELDLHQRLFKYACSYLIYSEAFAALPVPVKEQVYLSIWAALDESDDSAGALHVPADIKRATREILIETKDDFAKAVKGRKVAAKK